MLVCACRVCARMLSKRSIWADSGSGGKHLTRNRFSSSESPDMAAQPVSLSYLHGLEHSQKPGCVYSNTFDSVALLVFSPSADSAYILQQVSNTPCRLKVLVARGCIHSAHGVQAVRLTFSCTDCHFDVLLPSGRDAVTLVKRAVVLNKLVAYDISRDNNAYKSAE